MVPLKGSVEPFEPSWIGHYTVSMCLFDLSPKPKRHTQIPHLPGALMQRK